jgi:uncharacterized membrane protein
MVNVLMSVADRGGPGGRGGMMWGGHDRFGGGLFMIGCAVLLAAALGLLVWLLMRGRPQVAAPTGPAVPPAPSPLAAAEAILAERLARGEISPDDYRAAAAALRGQPVDVTG